MQGVFFVICQTDLDNFFYAIPPQLHRYPDKEIVDDLEFNGILILRTNVYDGACPTVDRVGRETNAVGGCSSYMLEW